MGTLPLTGGVRFRDHYGTLSKVRHIRNKNLHLLGRVSIFSHKYTFFSVTGSMRH